MTILASATTVWADIVGFAILAILALAIYFIVSLLFLPKTTTRASHRIEEEERRREQRRDGRHVA